MRLYRQTPIVASLSIAGPAWPHSEASSSRRLGARALLQAAASGSLYLRRGAAAAALLAEELRLISAEPVNENAADGFRFYDLIHLERL